MIYAKHSFPNGRLNVRAITNYHMLFGTWKFHGHQDNTRKGTLEISDIFCLCDDVYYGEKNMR